MQHLRHGSGGFVQAPLREPAGRVRDEHRRVVPAAPPVVDHAGQDGVLVDEDPVHDRPAPAVPARTASRARAPTSDPPQSPARLGSRSRAVPAPADPAWPAQRPARLTVHDWTGGDSGDVAQVPDVQAGGQVLHQAAQPTRSGVPHRTGGGLLEARRCRDRERVGPGAGRVRLSPSRRRLSGRPDRTR